MSIDIELQIQIDTQILEQGAFAPLEFLIDSGRLIHGDYESWRRREINSLDCRVRGAGVPALQTTRGGLVGTGVAALIAQVKTGSVKRCASGARIASP